MLATTTTTAVFVVVFQVTPISEAPYSQQEGAHSGVHEFARAAHSRAELFVRPHSGRPPTGLTWPRAEGDTRQSLMRLRSRALPLRGCMFHGKAAIDRPTDGRTDSIRRVAPEEREKLRAERQNQC